MQNVLLLPCARAHGLFCWSRGLGRGRAGEQGARSRGADGEQRWARTVRPGRRTVSAVDGALATTNDGVDTVDSELGCGESVR
jgi:hypothetical protein